MEFSIETMKADVGKVEKGRLACKSRNGISSNDAILIIILGSFFLSIWSNLNLQILSRRLQSGQF